MPFNAFLVKIIKFLQTIVWGYGTPKYIKYALCSPEEKNYICAVYDLFYQVKNFQLLHLI